MPSMTAARCGGKHGHGQFFLATGGVTVGGKSVRRGRPGPPAHPAHPSGKPAGRLVAGHQPGRAPGGPRSGRHRRWPHPALRPSLPGREHPPGRHRPAPHPADPGIGRPRPAPARLANAGPRGLHQHALAQGRGRGRRAGLARQEPADHFSVVRPAHPPVHGAHRPAPAAGPPADEPLRQLYPLRRRLPGRGHQGNGAAKRTGRALRKPRRGPALRALPHPAARRLRQASAHRAFGVRGVREGVPVGRTRQGRAARARRRAHDHDGRPVHPNRHSRVPA